MVAEVGVGEESAFELRRRAREKEGNEGRGEERTRKKTHLSFPDDRSHQVPPRLRRKKVTRVLDVFLVVCSHIHRSVTPSNSDETEDDLTDGLLRREDSFGSRVSVDGEDPIDVCESIRRRRGVSWDGDVREESEFEGVGGGIGRRFREERSDATCERRVDVGHLRRNEEPKVVRERRESTQMM